MKKSLDVGKGSLSGWATKDRLRIAAAAAAIAVCAFASFALSSNAAGVFNPTITLQTSTTRASAHPDARITIDNSLSDESIESVSLNLPNGFLGSLAAATRCTGTAADPGNVNFGQCPGSAQIGTIINEAVIDQSTVRIKGVVYLADAPPGNTTDPAAVIVKVHPQVGAVDFEDVVLSGRTIVRPGPVGPGSLPSAVGNPQGINTIIENIPDTVTDDDGHYDPVTFRIKKVILDLKSRFGGLPSTPPLLTNPSVCGTSQLAASYTSSQTSLTDSDTVNYTVNGCNTVKFAPTFSTTLSNPVAGGNTQLSSTIGLPADTGSGNGSFKNITVKLPPSMSANFDSLGSFPNNCNTNTANLPTSSFVPASCPPEAKIGTVTINTPLLPDPVVGDVYLIYKTPLPWIGIDVSYDPINHPDTPRGVTIRLVGAASTPVVDDTCGTYPADAPTCQTQVAVKFNNAPDAPVSSIQLHLNPPDNRNGTSLSGKPLTVISGADSTCQTYDSITASMTGNAVTAATGAVHRIQPVTITGCTGEGVTAGTGPFDGETTSTTPTFDFTSSGSPVCSIDTPTGYPTDTRDPDYPVLPTPCAGTYATSSLGLGIHKLFVNGSSKTFARAFVVKSGAVIDNTPPITSIDSGPADAGASSTSTPQFTFDSSEASGTFDCAVDDAAFLPCTSPYTTPELTAGVVHTFEVRATNPAGNLDITPAKRTFTVNVPFDPQITVTPTTNVARAHPELDVTVTSGSHDDMKNVALSLPDGFFGGLTGVAQVCTLAQADANPTTCPAASQVGTVDTQAEVTSPDGLVPSDVNISGKVFLAEGRAAGEPASLLISVHAKLLTVDLGYIQIPARFKVREHAKGIDSVILDVPKSITSVDGVNEFDLRKVVLHLQTGAGAAYPLLTNPSSCDPNAAFKATYASYDTGSGSTSSSDSSPFQVTGCDALGFAPALTASVVDTATGGPPGNSTSSKSVSATLSATLTADPGHAGITSTSILLPKPLTINVSKIPPVCEQIQFDTETCPAASAVGTASASTPLLAAPITGKIYLLRAIAPLVTPRMAIELRGPINTNIIAVNSFEPGTGTQIRTTITDLPDVPISNFSLQIANVVSTINTACDTPPIGWSMKGAFNGFNGKTAPIAAPLEFDCNRVVFSSVSKKWNGKKSTLAFTAKAQGKKLPFKKFTFTLPKGVTLNKKALAKKLIIRADGKKLKRKCFKVKRTNTIEINFCKKTASTVAVKFKAGSLNAKKKIRKPKLRVTAVDTAGKTTKYTTRL